MGFALDAITEHGLPVDRALQDKLRTYLESEEERIQREVQLLVPEELLPLNRKEGYKSLPKDLRARLKELDLIVPKAKLDYYLINHYAVIQALGYVDVVDVGLVKRLEFNPTSAKQLLAYIRHMGYPVPLHIDTGAPTTGKEELQKLIDDTGDEVLKLAQKSKKVSKLKGTYCSGYWIPGPDGRVHGKFRFGTASQQVSCTEPNIQQYPEHYDPDDEWIVDIMQQVKGAIKAEPGYKFVKVDARGAHGRMQGWLSEDADYYRLASLDLHSYNTAYFVNVPDKDSLIGLDDASLMTRLKEIKKQFNHERNFMVKRVSFLSQYGGGAEKASRILRLDQFVVQAIMDTTANRFPRTFKEFPKQVRRMLNQSPRLRNPFNCVRWIWDGDMEQAVAFLPSSCFHCHIQSALVRLFEMGAFAKYGACNFPHDAVWYHCREDLVDECIEVTKLEMERPSDVLVNSLGPFWCSADAQVGDSLLEVVDV